MNLISKLRKNIKDIIKNLFDLQDEQISNIEIALNVDKEKEFGDLNCNAALVLAKQLQKNPREIATQIQTKLSEDLGQYLEKIEIAGPGFLNLFFKKKTWEDIAIELFVEKTNFFKLDDEKKLKYLIEFVSANPTGPLHLGHGRGGIIGDVLTNVLSFLGHKVSKEFYINDAGSQIIKLGKSFKARCMQELGEKQDLPEDGYQGEYLIDLAKVCVKEFGKDLLNKDDEFFSNYAKNKLLKNIQTDLKDYGIEFDGWFSEKSLHENDSVTESIDLLRSKDLVYEKDGALWFKSTEFGDDKDRVIKKADGQLTYIAADIAYHKNKFDRGYDKLIDILGQDHHGYVKRLKATMQALGFDAQNLDVILCQLVSIKNQGEAVRMSKRAGVFTTLRDVIDLATSDVARFFYLNRKADAHLDFDLSAALKKTEENPVYYIQYAHVRINSIFTKAKDDKNFQAFLDVLNSKNVDAQLLQEVCKGIGDSEIALFKKLISLQDVLKVIENSYQTHLLTYYVLELVHKFHNYYSNNRVIDENDVQLSKTRLFVMVLMKNVLELCLDLLGISKPEKM